MFAFPAAAGGGGVRAGPGAAESCTLHLHSVHNVKHTADESYYGMATNHVQAAEPVTSERPARLSVRPDGLISVRVYLHLRGSPTSSDRAVGQISIPIREMQDTCGWGIYQTWFILEAPVQYGTDPAKLAHAYRHALHTAPHSLHSSRICLSLLFGEQPSDWSELVNDTEKVEAYTPLFVSHLQHLQLTRAYFDFLDRGPDARRSAKQPSPSELRGELERTHRQERLAEIEKLRQELVEVTEEANSRIEKGNETIIKLKAELRKLRDDEASKVEAERTEAHRSLQAAKERGRQLRADLDRLPRPRDEAANADLEKLRQDAVVLAKQKDALMQMVQQVYGGAGAPQGTRQEPGSPGDLLGETQPAGRNRRP